MRRQPAKLAFGFWTLICLTLLAVTVGDTTLARALALWSGVWVLPAAVLVVLWRRAATRERLDRRRRALTVRRPPLARRVRQTLFNVHTLRGVLGVVVVLVIWQVAQPLGLPVIQRVPPLSEVITRFFAEGGLFWRPKYWNGWMVSLFRIFAGFVLALLIGVPQGLAWGVSRTLKSVSFPVFEIFRPIPPLAFLPAAIYLMPTAELSIIFVIFLGAYFTIVINTINGVYNVDKSLQRAALSLGARRNDIFWKIIFPGTLPSIITGATVGMGITWMVLVAAEMIAGRSGIGFLTWESYTGGDIPQVVVGMVSMGIGGAICSAVIWRLGGNLMPWRRLF
jgi:NitT/TauT family transport system permease protein